MLSKEEMEKAKEDFKFFNEGDYITKEMFNSKEKIFEYIEQLESREQKLIEKLEEDKMEQFDDYVIYLLESYLEILKKE